MGLTYHLDGRVVRYVTVGDVDFGEGLRVLRDGLAAAAAADPAGRWGLVFDIRRSAENRSGDDMRDIAGVIATHRRHLSGRVAVVADTPLHYGVARMFAVFLDSLGLACQVVADPAEADAFVGMTNDPPMTHQ